MVANDACLHTIPRTINTGLGALFILTALYFLGGETLTDFALTLIVGILVGTYSSVLTATPLAVAFDRLSPAPVPAGALRVTARETASLKTRREAAAVVAATDTAPTRITSPASRPLRKRTGTAKRKRRRRR